MRQLLAAVAAAVVASVGAIVLGEYDLVGLVALLSGVLFGLAVTEAAIAVAHRLTRPTALVTAAISGLGFTWAVWIATNHFRDPIPVSAWVGVALSIAGSIAWSTEAGRISAARPKGGADQSTA